MTTAILGTWRKIKPYIWLALGMSCLIVTFLLWIMQTQKSGVQEVPIEIEAQQAARPVQLEAVAFDKRLGNFNDEVPPIDMTKRVVEVGEHEPEFRGSRFIAENQKAWTLQLMKVTEEDIIRAYLRKREDRNKFQYFRLQDEKHPAQFVLTYGSYKDVRQTIDQTQNINFALPESIKALPEKFSTYATLVNDLGSDEMATNAKLRSVVLTKAALPKIADLMPKTAPVTTPSPKAPPLAGTTTTIQRKDESGQVKSTHVERSQVAPKIDSPGQEASAAPTTRGAVQESQIVDPF